MSQGYDYAYIRALVSDMETGDSDACAALFAATYQDVYRYLMHHLKDSHAAIRVMTKLYCGLFKCRSFPDSGRLFLKSLEQAVHKKCLQAGGTEDRRGSSHFLTGRRALRTSGESLDMETAGFLLHHIFSLTHMKQCDFPLRALVSYHEYRRSRNTFQKVLTAIVLALFLLIPLYLMPISISVERTEREGSPWAPLYTILVGSFFPVDSVNAELAGSPVTVAFNRDGNFVAAPTSNGSMDIDVTLVTRRTASTSVNVTGVDYTVPVMVRYYEENGMLHIVYYDPDSGLDFSTAAAIGPDGSQILPQSIDEAAREVVYAAADLPGSSNLFISDIAGNTLQIALSRRSES